MNETRLSDNNWVDIAHLPVAPSTEYLSILFVAIVFIILVVVFTFIHKMNRVSTFQRKLKQLHRKINHVDNRLILQELEQFLCKYYRVSQLMFMPATQADWLDFRERLLKSGYQANNPDNTLTHDLISSAAQFSRLITHHD